MESVYSLLWFFPTLRHVCLTYISVEATSHGQLLALTLSLTESRNEALSRWKEGCSSSLSSSHLEPDLPNIVQLWQLYHRNCNRTLTLWVAMIYKALYLVNWIGCCYITGKCTAVLYTHLKSCMSLFSPSFQYTLFIHFTHMGLPVSCIIGGEVVEATSLYPLMWMEEV